MQKHMHAEESDPELTAPTLFVHRRATGQFINSHSVAGRGSVLLSKSESSDQSGDYNLSAPAQLC